MLRSFRVRWGYTAPWHSLRRFAFQETRTWEEWSDGVRPDVEKFWFSRLTELDQRMNQEVDSSNKCYVLSMFPYPSGRLHMGHLRVYTVTDVLARWQRLRGKFVIQPMGWDAFGLPAENAAIERGQAPAKWTMANIEAMRTQLNGMGLSLDWEREVATCDPRYYRWTQWLFLQLHRHGLTYQRRAVVNWDPVDRTVLADELVDKEGRSWRSGAVVEKRQLRQWFFSTTAYSESLLEGLESIEKNQWRDVVRRQRGWIGRLTGTAVEFNVKDLKTGALLPDTLSVFTESPEALFGVSFVLLAGENVLASDPEHRADTPPVGDCERLSLVAVHPLTGRELPIFLSRGLRFRAEECLDARLGIPALCEEQRALAERLSIAFPDVVDADGRLVNAGELTGQRADEAKGAAMALLRRHRCGGHPSSSLRTDWLISRQRFWGTPIPVVYCAACGVVPVPESDLPVLLPDCAASDGRMVAPLADMEEWRRTECPKCGGAAERETDTMDTFVDSSWYFLRYLDSQNDEALCDREIAHQLMPVDIYVGGIEHAIRHLFYARFIAHFLFDIGLLPQKEPFVQFLPIGLVMGRTFRVTRTGKYVPLDAVSHVLDGLVETATGEPVHELWDKMSKSKHNGTDPADVIGRLGVETTRLCILANTGPHGNRRWSEDAVVVGVVNWQRRLWRLVGLIVADGDGSPLPPLPDGPDPLADNANFLGAREKTLNAVVRCLEGTFVVSTAVARLQTLTDRLLKVPEPVRRDSAVYAEALCDLVVCLAPLAPMFASELWSGLQWALTNRPPARYDLTLPVLRQRFLLPGEASEKDSVRTGATADR